MSRDRQHGGPATPRLPLVCLAAVALLTSACGPSYWDAKVPARQYVQAAEQNIAGVALEPPPQSSKEEGAVKDQAAALAKAKQITSATCEVTLRMHTWDAAVSSAPVCIKEAGKGVAIPSRIALSVKAGWTTQAQRYCEELQRDDGLCVWNRKYRDNFPFDFVFATPDGNDIAERLSLIRVIRNGKVVYSWDPKQTPGKTPSIAIPSRSIIQPDYFKEPVDLGLYVLPSGVEAAQAAAADMYANSRLALGKLLGNAAKQALEVSVPEDVKTDFECLKDRIDYVKAVVQGDDTAKGAATGRIGKAKAEAGKQNAAAKAALPVKAATDEPLKDDKAPATVDGVALVKGDKVLFLDRDHSGGRIRLFEAAGVAWKKLMDSEVASVTAVGGTADRLVAVASGTRAKRYYRLAAWTLGDSSPKVTETVEHRFECEDPEQALAAANAKLEAAVKAAAKKGRDAVVGAVAKESQELAKEVASVLDGARRDLEGAMRELPPELRERLGGDLAWMRSVDDSGAQILEAVRTFQAVGPEMEAEVKAKLKDPAAQLRAYNEFARSLPSDETLWTARAVNPPPGEDEATLEMSFLRPRQFYAFLAWNAVPLPMVKAAHVNVTPKVDNLIPIIDVVGWYWQTGSSVLPTTGLGIGVIGTREEIEEPSYTTAFNVGPQANFSVSGFRLGVAHLIREADTCDGKKAFAKCFLHKNNMRVLVGADLIRLFTGKDTAAYKTTSN